MAPENPAAAERTRPHRLHLVTRSGVVDSISGNKSVRVTVQRLVKHPLYGKYIRRRTRLLVHDAKGEAQLGDTVEIAQCRPISKRKTWRLVRVIRAAAGAQQAGPQGEKVTE